MTPRELVEMELQIINLMFEERQEIYPLVIFIKDDQRFGIPAAAENNVHKDIIEQGIKDLVKKSQPDIVIYMAEAWVVIVKNKADRLPILPPRENPDRLEIVLVQIEFKTGEKFSCDAEILRNGDIAKLNKFNIQDGGVSMGRFMDFFPPKLN